MKEPNLKERVEKILDIVIREDVTYDDRSKARNALLALIQARDKEIVARLRVAVKEGQGFTPRPKDHEAVWGMSKVDSLSAFDLEAARVMEK